MSEELDAIDDELLEAIAKVKGHDVQKSVPWPVSEVLPVTAAAAAEVARKTARLNRFFDKAIAAQMGEDGITASQILQEREELLQREERRRQEHEAYLRERAKRLAKVFNDASKLAPKLLEGLEALKARPHSRFSYEVTDEETRERFSVTTNIRTRYKTDNGNGAPGGMLDILIAKKSGEITARGDGHSFFGGRIHYDEEVQPKDKKDPKEVLEFIARKAAKARLVL